MRDLIDEKNKRDKIKSSIIKRWNVNYMDAETAKQQEEEKKRLKEQEEDAVPSEEHFNKTTGAYSGAYGRGKVDDENMGQIETILEEKQKKLRDMIDHEKK